MEYTVLSPWARVNCPAHTVFSPRVDSLDGKTIGLFSIFKQTSPLVLEELGKLLKKRYPSVTIKALQYPRDTMEIEHDSQFDGVLKAWLRDVDTVIGGYGDAGSCAMYMAINTAYIERLGVPAVGICTKGLRSSAAQGASSHFTPHLRLVEMDMSDLSLRIVDETCIQNVIAPAVATIESAVIDALTRPMTAEEAPTPLPPQDLADNTITGTVESLNNIFYGHGWTNGTPIFPPTEAAVREMLHGTDLPRDHVVGLLAPRMGIATVEKIAVNAVMAGCLPTYLPALIAAVEAMNDPALHLVGWTCSVRSWMGPFLTINGPVRKAINMVCDNTLMAGYTKPSSAIARAFAYIIMNIAGVRPRLEDNAFFGGECRFGVCFAEDEENSPWQPHQTDFDFEKEDSTISLFWPVGRQKIISTIESNTPAEILKKLCAPEDIGFVPGCMYLVTPGIARTLQAYGMEKQAVIDYIVEYARRSVTPEYLRWVNGNHHVPAGVPVPADDSYSVRKFWDKDHICIIVGGSNTSYNAMAFPGGGDHGGPVCAKMRLPAHWDELVEKYSHVVPEYIQY